MRFFRKHEGQPSRFFRENTLDDAFDEMMAWVKDLSRKDYNKLKKAMDFDYDAYQALHGIEPEDADVDATEFMLGNEEGK